MSHQISDCSFTRGHVHINFRRSPQFQAEPPISALSNATPSPRGQPVPALKNSGLLNSPVLETAEAALPFGAAEGVPCMAK